MYFKRKLMVVVLAVALVVTFMPSMAFATGDSSDAIEVNSIEQLRAEIEKARGKDSNVTIKLKNDITGFVRILGKVQRDAEGNALDASGKKTENKRDYVIDTTKVTLDLNGHNITGGTVNSAGVMVTMDSTLFVGGHAVVTVKGEGTVTTHTDYETPVYNRGRLTIDGGEYFAKNNNAVLNRGVLTINDGTFHSIGNDPVIYSVSKSEETALTINGGNFSGECLLENANWKDDDSSVIINGGDFTETAHLIYHDSDPDFDDSAIDTITISADIPYDQFSTGEKEEVDTIRGAHNDRPVTTAESLAAEKKNAIEEIEAAYDPEDYSEYVWDYLSSSIDDYKSFIEEAEKITVVRRNKQKALETIADVVSKTDLANAVQELKQFLDENRANYDDHVLVGATEKTDEEGNPQYDEDDNPIIVEYDVFDKYLEDAKNNMIWMLTKSELKDNLENAKSNIDQFPSKKYKQAAIAEMRVAKDGRAEDAPELVIDIEGRFVSCSNNIENASDASSVDYYKEDFLSILKNGVTKAAFDQAVADIQKAYSELDPEDYDEPISEYVWNYKNNTENCLNGIDDSEYFSESVQRIIADAGKYPKSSEMETLTQAREEATAAIAELFNSLSESDYEPYNWEVIQNTVDNSEYQLQEAYTIDEVNEVKDQVLQEIKAFHTIAQDETISELRWAKENEIELLTEEYSYEDYEDSVVSEIRDLAYEYRQRLFDLEEEEAMNKVVDEFRTVLENKHYKTIEESKEDPKPELAAEVSEMIEALPSEPALSDRSKIELADYRFEQLNTATKALVKNERKLIDAKNKLQQLLDAKKLNSAKKAAIQSLDTFATGFDLNDYREAQKTEFNTAIASGKSAIQNATSAEAIEIALKDAKKRIQAIKTAKVLDEEELAAAKVSAKATLDAYDAGSYREAQQNDLATAIANGKTAIDEAMSKEAVNAALVAAKAAIAAIPTDAQLTAAELASSKAKAKSTLDTYKNAKDYRAAQQKTLANAIKNGKTAIDKAVTMDEINKALSAAKGTIDKIKTNKQMTDAEKAFARKNTPAKATITSVKKGKKKFTATWKKINIATGYQLRYSLKSNLSGNKTLSLTGAGATKKVVKGLKKKKTYYVQVRAFKKAGGKTFYGAWSTTKSVKTK